MCLHVGVSKLGCYHAYGSVKFWQLWVAFWSVTLFHWQLPLLYHKTIEQGTHILSGFAVVELSHQFHAKITVNTWAVFAILLLNEVGSRLTKFHFHYISVHFYVLYATAVHRVCPHSTDRFQCVLRKYYWYGTSTFYSLQLFVKNCKYHEWKGWEDVLRISYYIVHLWL